MDAETIFKGVKELGRETCLAIWLLWRQYKFELRALELLTELITLVKAQQKKDEP